MKTNGNSSKAHLMIFGNAYIERSPAPIVSSSDDFVSSDDKDSVIATKHSSLFYLDSNNTNNNAEWFYGPNRFVEYMNTIYLPFQHSFVQKANNRIVYEKMGTTGMAGQMAGICDILLLGVVHNRVVQMFAPALPADFFRFPLFNLTYHISSSHSTQTNKYSYHPSFHHQFSHVINYHWSRKYSGISTDSNFSALYQGNVVISSLHQFVNELMKLPSTTKKLKQIGFMLKNDPSADGMTWYRNCVVNLFQPNDFVLFYLNPYLEMMKGKYVIGLHVRLGQGMGKWRERKSFIKSGSATYQIPVIKKLMKKKGKSVVFLSTDSDKIESYFRRQFGNLLITANNLPRMHVGRRDATELGVLRSYIDIALLGQCNYLFLTPDSGFSKAGLAMNTKNPIVVYF